MERIGQRNAASDNNDKDKTKGGGEEEGLEEENDPLKGYLYAIEPGTHKNYLPKLESYLHDFLGIQGNDLKEQAANFLVRAKGSSNKWAYNSLLNFVIHLKDQVENKKTISGGTARNYYFATKLFYQESEIGDGINWNRLERGLPQGNSVANDRAPTLEEIRKIIKYPDIRVRVIVFIMTSSGIRIDAWNHLKWKHVTVIKDEKGKNTDQIVAARLQIKRGKGKQHHAAFITYITPEAYNALKEYMDFRRSHGEEITPESWLIRDKFQTTTDNHHRAAGRSMANNPKKLNSRGIQTLLSRAMWAQGVRDLLPEGEQRHDFKLSHGFRKYFATNAHTVMRPANVEYLLDHKIGVANSYLKPTEQDLLDDYVRAVDCLCIDNKDQKIATQLQKQVADLEEKRNHDNYEILGRLTEKEKEVEEVKAEQKAIVQLLKKMMIYKYYIDVDAGNPDVLEKEPFEETLKRVKISNRRLVE